MSGMLDTHADRGRCRTHSVTPDVNINLNVDPSTGARQRAASPSTHHLTGSWCSIMARTQLLRELVNERLAVAAEQIFRIVEKTIAEYQDEVVRSKKEVIRLKKHLEELSVLKAEVILSKTGVTRRLFSLFFFYEF